MWVPTGWWEVSAQLPMYPSQQPRGRLRAGSLEVGPAQDSCACNSFRERKESCKALFQAQVHGGELQSAPAGASGKHTAPALGARELELHTSTQHLLTRASRVSVSKLPGTCGLLACLQSGCHHPGTGGSKKPQSQQQSTQK